VRASPKAASRLIGLIVSVAALLFAVGVFLPISFPWSSTFHLRVQAAGFGQINPGAWVELSGAKIGSVDKIEDQNGVALLHLSVGSRYADQLHSDTTAEVRAHGLLGPKYIYLNGGRSGSLSDGALIPLSRTSTGSDFDQILNALQPDVRANLKTIFIELGRAADGRGAQMNAAFHALGQSAPDVSTTTTVLHNRDDDLAGLIAASEKLDRDLQYAPIDRQIADTDLVLSGLVLVEDSLGSGIDHTADVMQELDTAMNGNGANLAHMLAKGPATISQLELVANELDAILVGLNPALPNLMQAVMETKSAFSGKDANGHYVRIQVVPSATGPGQPPPPCCANGRLTSQAPGLPDKELVALFLGNQ
jgi:phospholipid/cholesterol/gamma-HCH transport system substrate-binding protein